MADGLSWLKPFPDGIPQKPFRLSSGRVDLPILYRDLTIIGAAYTADLAAVVKLLPSKDFRPLSRRGKALVTLAAFEYRDTTIGPYNEFAVLIPILYKPILPGAAINLLMSKTGLGRMGGYISHLPVTTKIALDAGKEVWGFPKIIADIRFEVSADAIQCNIHVPKGGRILKLSVPPGKGVPLPFPNMKLYTTKGKQVLRTTIETRGTFRRADVNGVELEIGNHPIARDLAGLGLSRKPVAALHSTRLKTRLPAHGASFSVQKGGSR